MFHVEVATPDLVLLRSIDELDIDLMKVRLAQATERLRVQDPSERNVLSWCDPFQPGAAIGTAPERFNLSPLRTRDTAAFAFVDLTTTFSNGVATTPATPAIDLASNLVEQLVALLGRPRLRTGHLYPVLLGTAERAGNLSALAGAYDAALRLMVARFAAIHEQWCRPDYRPDHVAVRPLLPAMTATSSMPRRTGACCPGREPQRSRPACPGS